MAAGTEAGATRTLGGGLPAWALGLIPLALIAVAIGSFALLGGPGLGERTGPPVEEVTVERTVLRPGTIELTLRNDGPDPVEVAQVEEDQPKFHTEVDRLLEHLARPRMPCRGDDGLLQVGSGLRKSEPLGCSSAAGWQGPTAARGRSMRFCCSTWHPPRGHRPTSGSRS